MSFSRISGNARKSLVCTRRHKNTMSKIQRLLQFYLQKTKDLLKINLLVWFQPRRVLYFENRAISTFIIFRYLTLKSRPGNLTHIKKLYRVTFCSLGIKSFRRCFCKFTVDNYSLNWQNNGTCSDGNCSLGTFLDI